jgi:hypothetical protein
MQSWCNLRYYLGICLEGAKKTYKIFTQNSQSLEQDLNLGHSEYEAGILPAQLCCLVAIIKNKRLM